MKKVSDIFKEHYGDFEDGINKEVFEDVKYIIDLPEGEFISELPEYYQTKLFDLLIEYYYRKSENSYKLFRPDKKIKTDIDTIQSFLEMLDKNLVATYRPRTSQPTIDFCYKLLEDLETETFELNQIYTNFDRTKNPIRKFFEDLPEEFKPNDYKIKKFIDIIKK